MRWLTRSVRLRVGLAALAGLFTGVVVLALLVPRDVPLVAASIVAAISRSSSRDSRRSPADL